MAHNEGPRQFAPQQILNAGFNSTLGVFSVSAQNGGYTYSTIGTSAQTLVKTGAGILGKIGLQSTLVSAVKVFDNTISGGNVLAYIPASTSAGTIFDYQTRFATGMVVSSGAAADTFNIIYN